ncbi:MAG: isoleucine--tRNA ligase [Eubacteriales bacterium]|nr:isoleucine--tRNA ligase [Eubacteriales bacterium]
MHDKVTTSLDFVPREHEILEYWKKNHIFEKSVKNREGSEEFSFYDGPPTANGMPHVGHLLTRSIKDLIPRYRTMKGYHVLRKAGWDTHGLPVELEVEKQLGLDGKPQIEAYGIEPFIGKCKESVWKYKGEWESMSDAVGFWADMENPYVTYDDSYIESEWWAIKTIAEKGLLYKGYKVVPYCPRCGTALSSHEVAQGYADVKETSIIARFRVKGRENTYILAWTTTPWTLPSNQALCVNAHNEYAELDCGGVTYIMAPALADSVLGEGNYTVIKTFQGRALVGTEYEELFHAGSMAEGRTPYVVADDYVTLTDGTGIVHIAPFGEDDMRILQREGIPFNLIVDAQGCFTAQTPWAGRFVKDVDKDIEKELKERGQLQSALPFEHSYPFCWRCDTPLLYYPRDTWFIKMTAVRDALARNNNSVNWIPENIRDGRMGNFLENVIDWGLSRERYWGTPLPVWTCECGHVEVIGSRAELIEKGQNVDPNMELHKPYIDQVVLTCPHCGKPMHREPVVIDCWFDSGSMPFAQLHYPFENKELFNKHFPADFISEAVDQTRGWFYTLLAISTLLFDKAPFKNCIVLGHVCDKDGYKMSKHKGNVINPWDMLNTAGADAVRWYFYTGSAPWLPSRFYAEAVGEAQRKYMGTLWNTYAFYVLYANIDNFDPTKHELDYDHLPVMDKWILSRLESLIKLVDDGLGQYRIFETARAMSQFVDELSNWYVRRGRERYWGKAETKDKVDAYMTLYRVLVDMAKLTAPFTPFMAEQMYLNLVCKVDKTAPESVHLCDFPAYHAQWVDADLERSMTRVLDIVVLGRACRSTAQVKNRQPVSTLYVEGEPLAAQYVALVADELNVKKVEFVNDASGFVDYLIKPQLRTLGPRFGKRLPALRQALQQTDGSAFVRALRENGQASVMLEGEEVVLKPEDVLTETSQRSGYVSLSDKGLSVAMDTNLTPELLEEGYVREVVSRVQAMRRDAGFEVTDHIALRYDGDEELCGRIAKAAAAIGRDTLADQVERGGMTSPVEQDINGLKGQFEVKKLG